MLERVYIHVELSHGAAVALLVLWSSFDWRVVGSIPNLQCSNVKVFLTKTSLHPRNSVGQCRKTEIPQSLCFRVFV